MKGSERIRDARPRARFLFASAIVAFPVAILVWPASPGFMGPMFSEPPWYVTAVPLLGIVGVLIGEVLMYRSYGADPDAGERTWRYRDF